jgi:hypothetical protein
MTEPVIALESVAEAVGPGLGANVLNGGAEVVPTTVPGVAGTVVWLVRDDRIDHPL